MKILITSDIHRNQKILQKVLKKYKKTDYHLDAGDSQMSLSFLDINNILSVKGNTDFFTKLPYERILNIDNKRILLIHGHHHSVKSGLSSLVNYAKLKEADICIYGHTHKQKMEVIDNITMLNPGALKQGKYAIYENGEITLY